MIEREENIRQLMASAMTAYSAQEEKRAMDLLREMFEKIKLTCDEAESRSVLQSIFKNVPREDQASFFRMMDLFTDEEEREELQQFDKKLNSGLNSSSSM